MVTDLAGLLRAETRLLHAQVESTPFMARMLAGLTPPARYCLFLRNLHPIYQSLEAQAQQLPGFSALAPLFDSQLRRLGGLEADLLFLHGPQWRLDLPVLPAAAAYARRLDATGTAQRHLLAAHAYVRYLGDLAGGQQLGAIVAASWQLHDAQGTQFYSFGPPGDVQRLVRAFRSALNLCVDNPAQAHHIVTEAKLAFQMHHQLFTELDAA